MKLEIDFRNTGIINNDRTRLTVYMSSDGWDSRSRWRQDMEYASQNENDPINEPISVVLQQLGLSLSDDDHEFDEDEECIHYKIVKI